MALTSGFADGKCGARARKALVRTFSGSSGAFGRIPPLPDVHTPAPDTKFDKFRMAPAPFSHIIHRTFGT
jgi:hypothetical protein